MTGSETRYVCVWLCLHRTYLDMTTSWWRCPLRHTWYSSDSVKTLKKGSRCCCCRCHRVIIRFRLKDCPNRQFIFAVFRISSTEVFHCILPFRLCQFVKLHLLLLKPLHWLWYHFSDCAHHPAGFVIFTQLALLCLFIMHNFPILPIVGTCKITQTVSDGKYNLLQSLSRLSVR